MKRLLSLKEAAEYCGVCENTFMKWVEAGEIPVRRRPDLRRNFYDCRQLDEFIDQMEEIRLSVGVTDGPTAVSTRRVQHEDLGKNATGRKAVTR